MAGVGSPYHPISPHSRYGEIWGADSRYGERPNYGRGDLTMGLRLDFSVICLRIHTTFRSSWRTARRKVCMTRTVPTDIVLYRWRCPYIFVSISGIPNWREMYSRFSHLAQYE